MAEDTFDDNDDAFVAIDRLVGALMTAGVGEDAIASNLMARSVFLWRQVGRTDDEIADEFASCIEVPIGRN